jgi:hypothetical protein
MNAHAEGRQAGVVLVEVLLLLTLFGLTGIAFAYSTAERQCEQNPTVEARDGGCLKEVGPPRGRP